MRGVELEKVNKLFSDMYDWIRSEINDNDIAQGITNQVHYLAIKYGRKQFVVGIIVGAIGALSLVKWLS